MNRIYGYLRASTRGQDAKRAKQALESFVAGADSVISGWFIENESGATLKRPELFRLLDMHNVETSFWLNRLTVSAALIVKTGDD